MAISNGISGVSLSPNLNDGYIFVGNSSNIATGVAPSGDVTINNAGVTAIKSNVALAGSPTTTTQSSSDNSTKIATTAYVETAIAAAVAAGASFRGAYDASSNLFPSTGGSGTAGAIQSGDFWVISIAGTLGGEPVAVGTMLFAIVDSPGQTASNWVTVNQNFVIGPSSATDGAIALYDGTSGKLIKNGVIYTNANTASTVVQRDASGNFTAGTITAALTGNSSTATALANGRTIAITGDLAYTSPSFDGSGNVTAAGTLATVNTNVGSFGSATQAGTFTVNAKGLVTAASNTTITPAVGSITGLGTGVATALAINVGTAGSPIVNGGALGTPSSGVATNLTGTAASLTAGNATLAASATALAVGRTLSITGDVAYTSPTFDGTANVTAAGTLATVNSNVGSFGSATQASTFTVDGKGRLTAASNTTVTPAVGSITGLGTGVATALAVNVGSAGAPVINGGALGTPSSGNLSNCTNLPALGTASATSLTFTSTSGIIGTTTNNSAAAGSVGEYIESVVSTPTNFGGTGTYFDTTSISLTAGDWDVSYLINVASNGATMANGFRAGVWQTTGNSTTGLVVGSNGLDQAGATLSSNSSITIPSFRISLSGTTTYYGKAVATYSVATPQYTCRLSARRVR